MRKYVYDKNVEWGSFSFEFGGKVQYILYLTYPLNIRLFHVHVHYKYISTQNTKEKK